MPISAIKKQLPSIPNKSGIYQFFDAKNQILYIGKAKNLYKRIKSYTEENRLSARILRMVFLAEKIETIQTETEVEALLLEHNLIKKLAPKFNILLRDDKTFPYIEITSHKFPRITKNRDFGKFKTESAKQEEQTQEPQNKQDLRKTRFFEEFLKAENCVSPDKHESAKIGRIFGPFASTQDVNRSIDVLRKIFLLRNCSDAEFKLRQKPCLEYQIKKCSAPCTGLISQDEYEFSVKNAADFLGGKSASLQKELDLKMQRLSANQNYEQAAFIRDQIKSLNAIQAKQNINIAELKNSDVITIVSNDSRLCVYVSFYRSGQNYGAKPYFYEAEKDKNIAEFLSEFLGQFYLYQNMNLLFDSTTDFGDKIGKKTKLYSHTAEAFSPILAQKTKLNWKEENSSRDLCFGITQTPPKLVWLNVEIDEKKLMEDFLTKISGQKIAIKIPKKGNKLSLIKDQETIAWQNLDQKISQNLSNKALMLEVKKIFDLPKILKRIEVYDNSHTSNTNAVGVMISAGEDGFIKNGYRKFNIGKESFRACLQTGSSNEKKSDDTAMMREVFWRRFSKLKKEDYPDLIIIDGGKPQLNAVKKVFDELEIKIPFIAMAKGENRNAGEESFYKIDDDEKVIQCASDLPKHHAAMYYLQKLRDEAHRFAITSHRKKRSKSLFEA